MQRKKTVSLPPLRLSPEMMKEHNAALKYFHLDRPAMARALIETMIWHAEHKDRVLWPLRLRCYGDGFHDDA